MAEEAGRRVQDEIKKLVDDLDRSHMRGMQMEMHNCAAKCCSNMKIDMDEVNRCVETCNRPIASAEQVLRQELSDFQDRLQRCVMQCQDDIKDKMTGTASESQAEKYRNQFESCVVKCADTQIANISHISRRIKNKFKQ